MPHCTVVHDIHGIGNNPESEAAVDKFGCFLEEQWEMWPQLGSPAWVPILTVLSEQLVVR